MKKLITLLILAMWSAAHLHAIDFRYEGMTFTILSEEEKTCAASGLVGTQEFDHFILPGEVSYNGEKYSVIAVQPNAFEALKANTVTIQEPIARIGTRAFSGYDNGGTTMTKLELPNTLQQIDVQAFLACDRLTEVIIPNSVHTLIGDCFAQCWGLKKVIIGTGLTQIGAASFQSKNIETVECYTFNPPVMSGFAFETDILNTVPLHVPKGTKDAYLTSYGWNKFVDIIDDLPVIPTAIAIAVKNVNIEVNEEAQLTTTVYPATTEYPLTFTSSDANVATVSESGVVKALAVGNAVITATCGDVSASCEVEVLPISVKGIELNASSVSLYSTEEFQLTATVNPDNAADKTVIWTSSDETVATVSETGLVKALKGGVAIISAKSGEITSSCVVVVTPMQITINQSNVSIEAEETVQLSATLVPEAYADEIEWATSDEKIATVTEEGVVTAVSVGNAVITASCRNVSATCDVEVLPISVKEITLDATTVSMYSSEEYQLTATVKPDNAADKTLIWKSSDESVATVSETGLISAHSVGSAIITAQNGNVTGSCVVVVLPKHVTLDEKEITLEIGSTKQLTAIVLPENVVNKNITWESTNPAVAEVSENGEVTALTSGVAVITATCGEGSAFCVVTVPEVEDATTMTLSIKLGVSKTLQLAAIISPDDAAAEVIWTSSNPEVADVSKDGLVSARTTGVAVITATYGENTVNCIFDVDNDSGVNEIMSTENGEVSVYNLQGIKMNVSTREEFNKLSPGYYIVNNQVELIK